MESLERGRITPSIASFTLDWVMSLNRARFSISSALVEPDALHAMVVADRMEEAEWPVLKGDLDSGEWEQQISRDSGRFFL